MMVLKIQKELLLSKKAGSLIEGSLPLLKNFEKIQSKQLKTWYYEYK